MHSQCSFHGQHHKLLSLFDPDDILVAWGSQWSVGLPLLDRPYLQLTHENSNYDFMFSLTTVLFGTDEEAAVPVVL